MVDSQLGIVSGLAVLKADKPAAGFCHSWDALILENRLPMVMAHKITDEMFHPFLKVK